MSQTQHYYFIASKTNSNNDDIVEIKNTMKKSICDAAKEYNWNVIPSPNVNMLSFKMKGQRINIWITKRLQITMRIQPLEVTKKNIKYSSFKIALKELNEIINSTDEYNDEGQI